MVAERGNGGPEKSLLGARVWLLGAFLGVALLGALWRPGGRIGALLGRFGGSRRPSWSHLEASEAHLKAQLVVDVFIVWKDFGFSAVSLRGSVAAWGRLEAILGLRGAYSKPS